MYLCKGMKLMMSFQLNVEKNVKKVSNPHFNFKEKIHEHPYDVIVILDHIDAAVRNEIYD